MGSVIKEALLEELLYGGSCEVYDMDEWLFSYAQNGVGGIRDFATRIMKSRNQFDPDAEIVDCGSLDWDIFYCSKEKYLEQNGRQLAEWVSFNEDFAERVLDLIDGCGLECLSWDDDDKETVLEALGYEGDFDDMVEVRFAGNGVPWEIVFAGCEREW